MPNRMYRYMKIVHTPSVREGESTQTRRKNGIVDYVPGGDMRGYVCTGKEGWIPRNGKGVLFTR